MSRNIKISKIREVVSNHPEDEEVCLQDLINNLIKLQIPLGKLEVHNYKDSVVDAMKLIISQEKLIAKLKYRIKNEIRPEVLAYHSRKPRVKKPMHPNSLANMNKKKE